MKDYEYVVVGAGFFGAVIAERIATVLDKPVLVLEKRDHIGGNCHSQLDSETKIEYHTYGTHIFHTSNEKVWDYISKFTEFNAYFHQVLTTYKDKVYQMPINLETINSFYNVNLRPYEVKEFLAKEIAKEPYPNPSNMEEKAISLMGRPLYEAFIKGYTKKQWQKDPKELPDSIIKRLPFRTNYNENYFFDKWQGIPLKGYTKLFENMLDHKNIQLKLNTDFFEVKEQLNGDALIIYSGPIDQYFDYKHGHLEWRTLKFEKEVKGVRDYQGTSVMNYAEEEVPYTRIHEPSHLHPEREPNEEKALIIKEFSLKDDGSNPYYPINDERNSNLVLKYREEADKSENLIISGRLGDYKYYDMHHTINMALELFEDVIKHR
ncbi:MAG: UDP-galactopyranose mutase [Bacteriovoracaceae bacterium]|jgi:UDP-galactopyranose mutase|nr:UDP-galactopyranose mutase [Bacteriovoracaceae bacterium]